MDVDIAAYERPDTTDPDYDPNNPDCNTYRLEDGTYYVLYTCAGLKAGGVLVDPLTLEDATWLRLKAALELCGYTYTVTNQNNDLGCSWRLVTASL